VTRAAAIDLGSNSIKTTCAEVEGDLRIVIDRETITRVGEGLERNGRLSDSAIERTMHALAIDVRDARAFGAEAIPCVATAGLRGAANAGVLLERAKRELDLDIEIIDGDREAELAFLAVSRLYPGPITVVDIGGRSTEVVVGDRSGLGKRISLELGSVRMTERHVSHELPTEEELAAVARDVDALLATAPDAEGELFGVSGTALALASFELGTDDMFQIAMQGEGRYLHAQTIRAAFEQMRRQPAKERIRGTAIPEGRADVVVIGALILLRVLQRYERSEMRISGRGLRHALLTAQSTR
jgi:exopolyphosphatase/guanosine-5'-triphosphate,3'-diphosphate pyrophosphatase